MFDLAIAELAARQQGMFNRAQVWERGGDDDLIHRRVRSRRWTDEDVGVYGLPGWPDAWLRDVWRAHLAVGLHSAAAYESAASIHRLYPFPKQGRIELIVPHGDHERPSSALVHQSRDLSERHIVVVAGLRVTSIPRTFCDLAAVARRGRLSRGIEQAHIDKKSPVSATCDMYDELRRPGKRGFKLLGQILEVRHPDFAILPSELEKRFRRLLRAYGIPQPTWEAPLPWNPSRRADGIWFRQRALVELDSRAWHARIDQMAADRKRDGDARRHGLTPYRFTYEEVKYESRMVADELRDALDLAA